MRKLCWALVAACGTTTPPPSPPATISVTTDVAPMLIAYRELGEAWQSPTRTLDASRFEIDVHGPYEVAVVCPADDNGDVATWRYARTTDDDHAILDVCAPGLPQPPTRTVSGVMAQPGSVSLAFETESQTTPSWTFQIDAADGTYNLVATDDARIAIQRDVTINGDTTLPTIDLDAGSQALIATPLSVANAQPSDAVSSFVTLSTGSTFAVLHDGDPATAVVAPPVILAAHDHIDIEITASDNTHGRVVQSRFTGSTSFTLPAIVDATFSEDGDTFTSTWTDTPDADFVAMGAVSLHGSASVSDDLEATRAYLAATGDASLTLDETIPGFDAGWRVDFIAATPGLSAFTDTADGFSESSVSPSSALLRLRGHVLGGRNPRAGRTVMRHPEA
jgi:hypothetical protein